MDSDSSFSSLHKDSLVNLLSNTKLSNKVYDSILSEDTLHINNNITNINKTNISKLITKAETNRKDELKLYIKNTNNINLCFLVDCTSSMFPYIDSVKKSIKSTINKFNNYNINLAFIGYCDYNNNNNISIIQNFGFNNSVNSFIKFLDNVVIGGGDDLPEDVLGGLLAIQRLQWPITQSTNILFHIADYCGHNKKWHYNYDRYPDGHPNDHSLTDLMNFIRNHNIEYYFGRISYYTNEMLKDFEKEYKKPIKYYDMKTDPRIVEKTLIDCITKTINTKPIYSDTISLSSRNINPITTCKRTTYFSKFSKKSNNTTVKDINFVKKRGLIINISDINSIDEIINYRQQTLTVKEYTIGISNYVIGKGSQKITYSGILYDKDEQKSIAIKQIINESSSDLTKLIYLQQQEIQNIVKYLAIQFNKLNYSDKPIFVINTSVAEINKSEYYLLEKKIINSNTTWIKFNSNYGYVNDNITDIKILSAFSHYTYHITNGYLLVIDLQGIVRDTKIIISDPAVHCHKNLTRFGKTNFGEIGINKFFETHTCNEICKDFLNINH